MGKDAEVPSGAVSGGLDEIAEILDEDHLEFEELLLNIQERIGHLETRIASLASQTAETRGELGETREIIETLDAKLDRLLGLLTGRANVRSGEPVEPADH
ncbi:MAG: hypothetical protein AB1752_00410 [Candidatus Zixiibacteriota bacterium]